MLITKDFLTTEIRKNIKQISKHINIDNSDDLILTYYYTYIILYNIFKKEINLNLGNIEDCLKFQEICKTALLCTVLNKDFTILTEPMSINHELLNGDVKNFYKTIVNNSEKIKKFLEKFDEKD